MNNAFLNKLISTDAGWGALALRIPVGIIFAAHAPRNCLAGSAATAWKARGNGWIPSG